jgi:squalene-hopene/tetraprenyl-beta-curcumene cyclase
MSEHYTLKENPGAGLDGFYYYLLSFARAMDARGLPTIDVVPYTSPDDNDPRLRGQPDPVTRDWANDLIDRLAELQNPDGSFRSLDDRWMENNTVLITAYSLLALQHAVKPR